MSLRPFLPVVVALSVVAASASAARAADMASSASPAAGLAGPREAPPMTEADFEALPHVAGDTWHPIVVSLAAQAQAQAPSAPTPRARAYEYSDGYRTRAKIHRYASFATLPLFVAQYIEGEQLFDGEGGSKSTHSALAFSIGTLFGVNSVTGVWNLIEARHDPNHRKRRLFHGLVMLGCDAGFVATGLLAPDDEGGGSSDDRSLHRNVAVTSMAIASANFVYMLLANR
ncbi:MAG: hypothetical protein ACHQRO_05670 [Vicinamibacteria bacterium]